MSTWRRTKRLLRNDKQISCILTGAAFLFKAIRKTTEISKVLSYRLVAESGLSDRDLALFVKFKKAYSTGFIYTKRPDHNDRKKRTGMPRTTFNRSINRLIEIGLAYKKDHIIHLKSKNEVTKDFCKEYHSKKLLFLKIDTSQDVRLQIQVHRINTKFRQIQYASVQKDAQNKSARKELMKLAREAFISVPNSVIAKTLCKSKSAAFYTIKKLEKLNLIQVKRNDIAVIARRISLEMWEHIRLSQNIFFGHNVKQCFWFKNRVFYHETNEYKLAGVAGLG